MSPPGPTEPAPGAPDAEAGWDCAGFVAGFGRIYTLSAADLVACSTA